MSPDIILFGIMIFLAVWEFVLVGNSVFRLAAPLNPAGMTREDYEKTMKRRRDMLFSNLGIGFIMAVCLAFVLYVHFTYVVGGRSM